VTLASDPVRSRDGTTILLVAITVVAGVVRYVFAIHAGFSSANDIDGPTYFAGAVQLAYGRIPYRDFAFVQPPAVLLLASPFALASHVVGTRDAFTAIRVAMPLVGVANVWLAGRRVCHRGPVAVLVAAGGLAAYMPAIISTRTLLLEPWLDLFCLLALTFAFDAEGSLATPRRVGIAGVFIGLAVAVKLWAVFPLVVLLAWCLWGSGRGRRVLELSIGTVVGFGVVSFPFAVLSPGHFVHDVVISQLARFGRRIPFSWRMGEVLGITPVGKPHAISMLIIVVAFAMAAVLLLATARALSWLQRRASSLAVFSAVCTVVVFAVLMVPGEFPYHYPDFLSPFAVVTFGLAAGTLAERFARRTVVRGILAAVVAAAVAGVLVNDEPLLAPLRASTYGSLVDHLIPKRACVVTDYMPVTIQGNRFITTDPNCPVIVDPFGLDLTLDNGNTPVSPGSPTAAVVSFWRSAFEHTNWIVLTPSAYARIPLVPSMKTYVRANFTVVGKLGVTVYERTVIAARSAGAGP
jgi:4-amino-4-deoxy-L-arabinose transferase-like glycosyltransferase